MIYGDDEEAQHQMDRGREQQDREEEEASEVEDYAYDEDVAYEGTEYAEFDW